MIPVIESVLKTYLKEYRRLIAVEYINESAVLSLPLHLAANHRIEITVTPFGKGRLIISDSARTLGEIEAAGYVLTRQMRERLEQIAEVSGVRVVDRHLVLHCTHSEVGRSIQEFLEVCKTLGDVYLVHKHREAADDELVAEVRSILDSRGLVYKLDEKIQGKIEKHPFDLVVPPNGHPGLAVGVLGGQNTHSLAQIWYFRCDDVRNGEWYRAAKARLAVVFDVRQQQWSEASKEILGSKADIAVPSDSLEELRARLK